MADLAVVMVSASFHPYVGGAEKQALELSAALRGRGVRVRVLTRRLPGLPGQDEVRGVPVERLACFGPGFLNAVTFMLSLGWWLWRHAGEYSVVHVHLAGSPALPAALAGNLLKKRVVIKLGGGRGIGELAASAGTWGGRLKLRLLSRLRPRFVAVCRDLAEECAQYLGPVPLRVLPNGVDISRYHPVSSEVKAALRSRLGWPEGLGFLYVGRLIPEKQLSAFLQAWIEQAAAAKTAAFLAFVGDGPEEKRLRELAAHSPLGARILVRPALPDVEQAYAAADVFVLPSVSEGLSNALLEAMASGLAVLGSRVGGTAETVRPDVTGLLFGPQDAAQMRRQIARFLAEPELCRRLGAAARQQAAAEFAIGRVAEEYLKIYSE